MVSRKISRWLIAAIIVLVVVSLIAVVAVSGVLTPQKFGLEKARSQGKIIMGTEATSPPFESRGPNNKTFYGFDIDLAKKIVENVSKRTGTNITLEIQDMGFGGIPTSLQSNHIDMGLSKMAITSSGNETVLFSIPYYSEQVAYGLMVKNGTTNITSINDIVSNKSKIVVKDGTISKAWVQENLVDTGKVPSDNVRSLPTTGSCVQDVTSGKSDVFIIDKLIVDDYVVSTAGAVVDAGTLEVSQSYGVAFNRNSGDLKTVADEVISNMTSNGEMASLRAKWGL